MARRIFPLAVWLAALIVLALSMTHTPARPDPAKNGASDDGVEVTTCLGGRHGASCVTTFRSGRVNPHIINVPQPQSAEDRAAAEARDRRWVERCRPTIRQDQHGMPRYVYAAQGCEYGRLD